MDSWEEWNRQTLDDLASRNLLRAHRTLITTGSSVKVKAMGLCRVKQTEGILGG